MGKAFLCSLCHNGILGGGLYLERQAVIYRTQKLTVPPKYRELVLPLDEIGAVTWKSRLFPVATFHMKNGEAYQLIIFNKQQFDKHFREYVGETDSPL